jgi:hypothetical protein
MNLDEIYSHSEYHRQLELERLLREKVELTEEQKDILRNHTSNNYVTQFSIGLILRETTLLNLARLIPMAMDPYGLEEYKIKAFEIIGDIDLENVVYEIAGIIERTEVEGVVYRNVFLCDFI